jgi:hypothetical protein
MITIESYLNEDVYLELFVTDWLGNGVSGLSPTLSIRNLNDSYYLDFNDNTFKNTGWTTQAESMSAVDSTLSPGVYQYTWDSSLSVSGVGRYSVEYDVGVDEYRDDIDYVDFVVSGSGSTSITYNTNAKRTIQNTNNLINTYTDIYVNLNRTTSASSVLDDNDVVVCNDYTKTGLKSNPLNLNQFREYLQYDHDFDQNFYLSGNVGLGIVGSSTKGLLGNNTFLETPHKNRKIKITNWKDNFNINQTPYTITIYSDESIDLVNFITNDDDVEISNGNFQVSGGCSAFSFGDDVDIVYRENNTLRLINDKFYTNKKANVDEDINSFEFKNYNNVIIDYCLLNNKSLSGSMAVINDKCENCNYTILNSIVVGVDEFVGYPNEDKWQIIKSQVFNNTSYAESVGGESSSYVNFNDLKINLNVDSCVFTSELSAIGDDVYVKYYNLLSEQGNNEFGFSIPSIFNSNLATLSQENNFNYLHNNWIDISISGTPKNNYNSLGDYNNKNYVFSELRDGVGPLTFNRTPQFYVSASLSASDIGENVTFVNRSSAYESTYYPSYYEWDFDDSATSAITSGGIQHSYDDYGIYNINVKLHSKNDWYQVNSQYPFLVKSDGNFDFDVFLFVTSSDGYNDFYVSATSAHCFDEITVSAVNNSNSDNEFVVFTSWGEDFDEDNLNLENFYLDNNFGLFSTSGGIYTNTNRYNSSGTYNVYFATRKKDGAIYYKGFPLEIYNNVQDEYYVNLNEIYDKDVWWTKETVIYDDFEDGLDVGWSTQFKTNYTTQDMWDDNIAYCPSASTPTLLVTEYVHYDFEFEFSFIRNNRDYNPYFNLSSDSNNVLKIQWDYNNDRIKIYYYDETVRYVKYDLKKCGLTRDLRCVNSLRELKIKIVHTPIVIDTIGLKFYYSLDGLTWIETAVFDEEYIDYEDSKLLLYVDTNEYCGFGYMKLQSKFGLPYVGGSEDYPLSYSLFKERVEENGNGNYNDKFLCKGFRTLYSTLRLNSGMYYEVDGWDLSLYGPWMLIVDVHTASPFSEEKEISFAGSKISNGIVYNIKETTDYNNYFTPNLSLSLAYDMFIVWHGYVNSFNLGYVRLKNTSWKNRDYTYKELVGCTLKSELGVIELGDI